MAVEKRKRGRPRKVVGADVEAVKPKRGRPRKSALANPPAGMQKRRGRPRKNPLENQVVVDRLLDSDGSTVTNEDYREYRTKVLREEVENLRLKMEKKHLTAALERMESGLDPWPLPLFGGVPPAQSANSVASKPGKLTHSRAIEELEGQLAAWTKTMTERFEAAEGRIASLENKVG